MKIIVAHPSKQHSFRTAVALKTNGCLFKYVTSVYDKKGSLTYFLKRFLSKQNRDKAGTRKIAELETKDVLCIHELSALFLLLIRRMPFINRLYNTIFVWRRKRFGKSVAKIAIKENVDAVIMYDSTALECFYILKEKAPHIKRILDVSIAHRAFLKHNFDKDIERTNCKELMKEERILWNKKMMDDYKKEVYVSDYFFVPSRIVRQSLNYVGVENDKIYTIPYGVDTAKFDFIQKNKAGGALKLLFVGQVNYRKGIHHLLKVVSMFDDNEVELFLAGTYNKKTPIYQLYKNIQNVHFLGFVTRNKLASLYQECDIFVFPTLGEGYGMVVLEALSCGMPCVISDLAGGDDAITEGYNGYVFHAGDDADLHEKILQFVNNPREIAQMSTNAKDSVRDLTWNDYYSKVNDSLLKILNNINS